MGNLNKDDYSRSITITINLDESEGVFIDFAYCHSVGAIPVIPDWSIDRMRASDWSIIPVKEDRHVDIEDVSRLQRPSVWNPVSSDVVHFK